MKPLKLAVVDRRTCVACGACAKVCPRGAIQIVKGCYSEINPDLCVGCGICAKECPASCIETKLREELNA
ncbi:MAG: 4Fe-4S dicluster domain-containing protein [Lachnospiraceae bacterium]|nr:4Fe-4S dicluster domain-containing protein [Lachnospiraceae bacterium]